jgi:hypothetical protein
LDNQLVRLGDMNLDNRLVREVKDRTGGSMMVYKHWIIKTKEREYKITNLDEYKRIAKAMATPDIRFIRIQGDLVNIGQIEGLLLKKEFVKVESDKEKR